MANDPHVLQRSILWTIAPVNPSSKEPKHYEVLVRMVDETGELVVPDHFVPAAERYILMPAVDRWAPAIGSPRRRDEKGGQTAAKCAK